MMTRAFTKAITPYEVCILIKEHCSALSVTLVSTEKVQVWQIITGTSESKSDIGEKQATIPIRTMLRFQKSLR